MAESTERRDALVERLFINAIGAFDLFSVYVGDRLGLYNELQALPKERTMRTRITKFVAVVVPALVLACGLADNTLWP